MPWQPVPAAPDPATEQSRPMPPDTTAVPSRFEAALVGAGDLAHDWELVTDGTDWLGAVAQLGIGAAVATGRSLTGLVNPEDLAARQHRLSRHSHAGEAFACEYRLRAEDGSFSWVQDRGSV